MVEGNCGELVLGQGDWSEKERKIGIYADITHLDPAVHPSTALGKCGKGHHGYMPLHNCHAPVLHWNNRVVDPTTKDTSFVTMNE
jgi:hypothetical protein